jgi:hypothetical protein
MFGCAARAAELAVSGIHRIANVCARNRQLRMATMAVLSGVCAMSDIADMQSSPTTRRGDQADKQAFAQVEKWMAMIREITHERQAQPKPAG